MQDVNQSLVDDGLVDIDKIGSSNFFWSFPSKVVVTRQNLVNSLQRDITKVCTRTEFLIAGWDSVAIFVSLLCTLSMNTCVLEMSM